MGNFNLVYGCLMLMAFVKAIKEKPQLSFEEKEFIDAFDDLLMSWKISSNGKVMNEKARL